MKATTAGDDVVNTQFSWMHNANQQALAVTNGRRNRRRQPLGC